MPVSLQDADGVALPIVEEDMYLYFSDLRRLAAPASRVRPTSQPAWRARPEVAMLLLKASSAAGRRSSAAADDLLVNVRARAAQG